MLCKVGEAENNELHCWEEKNNRASLQHQFLNPHIPLIAKPAKQKVPRSSLHCFIASQYMRQCKLLCHYVTVPAVQAWSTTWHNQHLVRSSSRLWFYHPDRKWTHHSQHAPLDTQRHSLVRSAHNSLSTFHWYTQPNHHLKKNTIFGNITFATFSF